MPAGSAERLLLKGIEEEVYTGTRDGEVLGLSPVLRARRPELSVEPDSRNVEYITTPLRDYRELGRELLRGRLQLRRQLAELGSYTVIPGATLSLGDSHAFYRSEPGNDYHSYIERTYGSSVVTTGEHLNIGIDDPEVLLRAWRLIRMEACLFLALTACSPFLDGRTTGYHSTRWQIFPRTPRDVPVFASHAEYADWIEAQLAAGTMQNIRHVWLSVRPNGTRAPRQLERLELRICDSTDDLGLVLALMALLEARVWQVLTDERLDPLATSDLGVSTGHRGSTSGLPRAAALASLAAANDAAVCRLSLEAEVRHWQDGRPLAVREWLARLLDEVTPVAEAHGFARFLSPVRRVLAAGNTAQRWLDLRQAGYTVREVVLQGIGAREALDRLAAATLARDLPE